MLWKPVPLKATPTGLNTLLAGALHEGQHSGTAAPIGRETSNTWSHAVQRKSYAGILGSSSRNTVVARGCSRIPAKGRKAQHLPSFTLVTVEDDETYQSETAGEVDQARPDLESAVDREIDFFGMETPDELRLTQATPPTTPAAVMPSFTAPPGLDRPRPERPPVIPRIAWIIVAAALTVVVLGVAAWLMTIASSVVIVPDVVGKSMGEATTNLAQTGLRAAVAERRFSAQPEGEVLEQIPAASTQLSRGEAVQLVVSAGTEELVMPDVIGDGIALARGVLEERGLVVTIEMVPSDAASDTVIMTTPASGTIVRSGDIIRIQVAAPLSGGATLQPYLLSGLTFFIDPAPVPKGEKDYTMEVARRVRSLLEASGATVELSRSGKATGKTETERATSAVTTSATAGIGLSVRARGKGGRTVSGPAQNAPGGPTARIFVRSLVNELASSAPPAAEEAGVTDKVFLATDYPWARVGLGALDDRSDKSSLEDPAWLDRIAASIYQSVGEVFGTKEQ